MDENKNFENVNEFENTDKMSDNFEEKVNHTDACNNESHDAQEQSINDATKLNDDFEENKSFVMQGEDADSTENVYSAGFGRDFNTSGADYDTFASNHSYYANEDSNFYNTNIRKKEKRGVPVFALIAAIAITAVLSVGGALGYNMLFGENGSTTAIVRENLKGDKKNNDKNSSGAAVVKTSTAERDGKSPLTTPEIVDTVGPAVVGIINTAQVVRDDFFYEFFGEGGSRTQESSGSGVIISADGYIVTNNHVVESASELTVIMNTGDEYKARLVGADSKTDLAVIKIDAEGLTFAPMGKSSDLRVGDTAIAIGNPLGQEFAGTTTQGIISGLNRSVTIDNKQLTLIQTDAAINPGNSGGALVDAYGHLIGINTAKISSSALEGLGFAIPIDEAKPIITELIDNGYVTGRPILGIGGRAVTEEDAKAYNLKVGIYVTSMSPNSPAYMAGIKIADIIYECEGEKVETVEELNKIKNRYKPGDILKLKVYRQGKSKSISVVLGEEAPGSN